MRKLFFLLLCGLMAGCVEKADHLTILHTNDTHSQVEPLANGKGGYARRMGLINQERAKDANLILVDAGDFSQGTPYFNFFHGRVEVDAMNRMGYDVATLGNHEFDNGVDTLAAILRDAKFDVVCANYDLTGSKLEGLVKPYTILHRGGLKIGVFGLGVAPGTLIAANNFQPLEYLDPYKTAQQTANILREKGCDVVVCLSHLGTVAKEKGGVCDTTLAKVTKDIDVIIGGHTHQILDLRYKNLDGKEIPVVQCGKSGVRLGKITLKLATN